MKLKQLCAFGLTFILALSLAVPTLASEESGGQEPIQSLLPEEEPVSDPVEEPSEWEEVLEPEESQEPTEPPFTDGLLPPEETPDFEEPPTPSPDESLPPDEIPEPDESLTPDETPEPSESLTPDEILEPDESPEPEESLLPNEEEEPLEDEDTAEPQEELPVIQVTISETGAAIINPYGLPVEIEGETYTEQIVNPPQIVTNESSVPVTVWASAVGSISELSTAVFAPQPPQKETPAKEIFLYVEFQKDENESWSGGYFDGDNQILVTDQPSEPKAVLTLDAGSEIPVSGKFRLFGSTSVKPEIPWSADDSFQTAIVFTFTTDFIQE